jgi:probable HAF family extracellular repeat protein
MKFTIWTGITGTALVVVLSMPIQTIAQERQNVEHPPHYTVTDLGTLGGTYSIAFGPINGAGWVGGGATLLDGDEHAFLWDRVRMRDLGTLGGLNSEASGPNASDEVAILSETSNPGYMGEDFCGFGNHLQCLAATWKNGTLTPLPTLPGGYNAQAYGVNNRGQIFGIAENGNSETPGYCATPNQVLDFEVVLWSPKAREIVELPPLSGDTVGISLGINDEGQVVGSSGLCSNTTVTGMIAGPHAVLWENGSATDLGNLGGTTVNSAAAINDRGEVAGASELAGDTSCNVTTLVGCTEHAFLWTKDKGMRDIGTLSGDVLAAPGGMGGINNREQVVGASCNSSGDCRAFLWQNEVMTDLNTLIPADSPLYLVFAFGINDSGEIAGFGATGGGDIHAFLAVPNDANHADRQWGMAATQGAATAGDETTEAPRPALSENARKLLREQMGRRYHVAGPQ